MVVLGGSALCVSIASIGYSKSVSADMQVCGCCGLPWSSLDRRGMLTIRVSCDKIEPSPLALEIQLLAVGEDCEAAGMECAAQECKARLVR